MPDFSLSLDDPSASPLPSFRSQPFCHVFIGCLSPKTRLSDLAKNPPFQSLNSCWLDLCYQVPLFIIQTSVRLSVTQVLILHFIRFFEFFCINLALYKLFEVQYTDFLKKSCSPNLRPKGPKWPELKVFSHYLQIAWSDCANFAHWIRNWDFTMYVMLIKTII